MKAIILREKSTGKVCGIGDYDKYLQALKSEERIRAYISQQNNRIKDYSFEIVELDGIAEFYGMLSNRRDGKINDIVGLLRDITRIIDHVILFRDVEQLHDVVRRIGGIMDKVRLL